MTPSCASRFSIGISWVVFVAVAFPQPLPSEAPPASFTPVCAQTNAAPIRAYPFAEVGCGRRIQFVGIYGDDGVFREPSRLIALRNRDVRKIEASGMRPAEVPRFIRLNPLEHVVENYSYAHHARQKIGGHRKLASFLDGLVTLAYGRERALLSPGHLTTDSRGRLIVSDAEANAVHVLDGERSFRIAGGPHRVLGKPAGVALDTEDNIYVADAVRGLVEVYTPQGQFVRYIGRIDDESLFEMPTDIAIDREKGRLYVVDFLRDRLFVMDLGGRILERVGLHRSPDSVEFDHPTNVALGRDFVAVLDEGGSRVQVLDYEWKLRKQFSIALNSHEAQPLDYGLAMDAQDNVYVNDRRDSLIHVYSPEGEPVYTIGAAGVEEGEFLSPQGVWIDSENRIYVSDAGNRRVQLFQLRWGGGAPPPLAAAVDTPEN